MKSRLTLMGSREQLENGGSDGLSLDRDIRRSG